jgi:hypothetical protein
MFSNFQLAAGPAQCLLWNNLGFAGVGCIYREGSFLAGVGIIAMPIAGFHAYPLEGVVPTPLVVPAIIIETNPLKLAAPTIGGRRFPFAHLLSAVRAYGFVAIVVHQSLLAIMCSIARLAALDSVKVFLILP